MGGLVSCRLPMFSCRGCGGNSHVCHATGTTLRTDAIFDVLLMFRPRDFFSVYYEEDLMNVAARTGETTLARNQHYFHNLQNVYNETGSFLELIKLCAAAAACRMTFFSYPFFSPWSSSFRWKKKNDEQISHFETRSEVFSRPTPANVSRFTNSLNLFSVYFISNEICLKDQKGCTVDHSNI